MLKIPTARCPEYLKWVKTLPCCQCGMRADDPHHIKCKGVGGYALTAADSTAMPLCRTCHQDVHKGPGLYPQTKWMCETQAKAFAEGKIKWGT